ncbi:hypothetical protein QE436_004079 [Pantoea anthophila]|nr:hypothetical protein [Pantoea anthophila]
MRNIIIRSLCFFIGYLQKHKGRYIGVKCLYNGPKLIG